MSDDWPDPNEGSKPNLDLGGGHILTWSTSEGEIVGGIIRHDRPENPAGYCDGAFWLRGNSFSAKYKPGAPQWDLIGGFESPTLSPSFLCHCGDHGFIRSGRWEQA